MSNLNESLSPGRCCHGLVVLALGLLALGWFGCSVNVDSKKGGGSDNVDVKTPFGGIHIHDQADARDTGFSVYPGAHQRAQDDDDDSHAANLGISTSAFGLKVIAVEYESEDAPRKISDYYKKELQKYGKVLECKGTHGTSVRINSKDSTGRELACDSDGGGDGWELKAGSKDNYHLVAIEPHDKGTRFGLVHIVTRGEQEPI